MAQEPESPDLVSEYYWLLTDAQQASNAVDMFDLKSEDPESVKAFRKLKWTSFEAQTRLIQFIQNHHSAILKAMSLDAVIP